MSRSFAWASIGYFLGRKQATAHHVGSIHTLQHRSAITVLWHCSRTQTQSAPILWLSKSPWGLFVGTAFHLPDVVDMPLHFYTDAACAGGPAASLLEQPETLTNSSEPLHAVHPNTSTWTSSQSQQSPVKPSPLSPGHSSNVATGHAVDVGNMVSPIRC